MTWQMEGLEIKVWSFFTTSGTSSLQWRHLIDTRGDKWHISASGGKPWCTAAFHKTLAKASCDFRKSISAVLCSLFNEELLSSFRKKNPAHITEATILYKLCNSFLFQSQLNTVYSHYSWSCHILAIWKQIRWDRFKLDLWEERGGSAILLPCKGLGASIFKHVFIQQQYFYSFNLHYPTIYIKRISIMH